MEILDTILKWLSLRKSNEETNGKIDLINNITLDANYRSGNIHKHASEEAYGREDTHIKTPEEIAEDRITEAKNLQISFLNLSGLGLAELPESLWQLTQLKKLTLSNNKLSSLPECLGQLVQLEILEIDNNNLIILPDSLCLLNLVSLIASHNHFNILPKTFGKLTKLQQLDLSSNVIVDMPEMIGKLTQLNAIDFSCNKLTILPKALDKLVHLNKLFVSGNQLTALPKEIGHLTQLQTLDVSNNQLKEIPESIRQFKNLSRLFLHGNSTLGLSPAVLGPTALDVLGEQKIKPADPGSILDYYFSLRAGKRPLNEVRLLLVGRGSAGKTSIVRRLIEDKFDDGQLETKGIDIRPWELQYPEDTVRAHVWDFAGQVITHATHQFFLSHRSVYVLVLTGREDSEMLDAEYWLRLIRAFGTDHETGQTSPVLVAMNKCETAPCKLDCNALQEKYPFIKEFVETDCSSGHGINVLKDQIFQTVASLDSVREWFPKAWFQIKEQLSMMAQDYLSYSLFREQCAKLGEVDKGRQDSLAQVLHRLGVALNYSDDERLREATVLNPHWVTNGIYTLLRDAACENGIMTMADVARVLPKESPEMRRYLVELMRRFDLAFPLTENCEEWLVPQQLPPTQPKLGPEWHQPELTRLRYQYAALPEGLIPRFITRTYPLSEGQLRWVNGVILQVGEARALVRADQSERLVTVVVSGYLDNRRRLAGLVHEDLQLIHSDIRGLDPVAEMELEGRPGQWVRLKALESDERKGQKSAAVTDNGTFVVDNTSELNRLSKPASRDRLQRKAKLFISYSSMDTRDCDQLKTVLKILRSEGLADVWEQRCLVAGQDWDKTIKRELESADMVLLLWSQEFEASGYIREVEIKRAVELAKEGKTRIVSIILKPCGWERHDVAKFQVLPPRGKPVSSFNPRATAWYLVREGLYELLQCVPERTDETSTTSKH